MWLTPKSKLQPLLLTCGFLLKILNISEAQRVLTIERKNHSHVKNMIQPSEIVLEQERLFPLTIQVQRTIMAMTWTPRAYTAALTLFFLLSTRFARQL